MTLYRFRYLCLCPLPFQKSLCCLLMTLGADILLSGCLLGSVGLRLNSSSSLVSASQGTGILDRHLQSKTVGFYSYCMGINTL